MPQPDAPQPSRLDTAIANLVSQLETMDPTTEEYAKANNQLAGLYKLNEFDKPEPALRVDPNTLVLAATNIAGILLVLGYEHANVITSKAFGFIRPAR